MPCTSNDECSQLLRPGSVCLLEENDNDDDNTDTPSSTKTGGVCSNPYAQGCIRAHLESLPEDTRMALVERFPEMEKGRICNSDDDDDDTEESLVFGSSSSSLCYDPLFTYPEIRIHNGNWESSIFLSWIFQIVLMELVQVPVTIGLGPTGGKQYSGIQDNTYDNE